MIFPGSQAWRGPLLGALWSADKDNMDDKRNISRTKEIPCFIASLKEALVHWESQVWGIDTDFSAAGTGERQGKARSACGTGAAQLAGSLLPNFIWGAPGGVEVKKCHCSLLAFVAAQSQTVSDGVRRLESSPNRTMSPIEESQKKH